MRITVFNQHHHSPDCPATCRHYTFLEYLAKHHEVNLITSNAWKKLKKNSKYSWVPEGVKLYEQDVAYNNKMGVLQRLFSYGGYATYGLAKGLTLPKPDLIWGISTPLSTPWVAAQVARIQRVPWVFEVQDLWPSFPIEMGAVKNKWLQQRLFDLERNLYHSARHIITLSEDMSHYVKAQGISENKVSTIVNGTDLELVDAVRPEEIERMREEYSLEGKQVVLYAGTYGRANDIPTLIKAAEALAADENIKFVFTGNGYYALQLEELAQRLPNVLLLPPQPRPDIFKLFKLADLSLACFNDLPVLATNSPAKFYDSLACGTPVIVTNLGWTKAFVEKYNCGWYSPAEDAEALAKTIKQVLMNPDVLRAAGKRGEEVAQEQFDRQKLVMEVENIFLQISQHQHNP